MNTHDDDDWATRLVISLIAEQRGVDPATISPSDRLRDYAELDSLDHVELLMNLEDQLDLDLSEDNASKFETVQDVIVWVRKRTK